MQSMTLAITAQPEKVSSWVPTYVLVANQGTDTVYFGGADVSPSNYAVAVEPKPSSTTPSLPVDVKEIAVSSATKGVGDLFAVTAGGTVAILVTQYGGGGRLRLDALRALVSEHTGGVPVQLLAGETVEEIISSADAANAWLRGVIAADSGEVA